MAWRMAEQKACYWAVVTVDVWAVYRSRREYRGDEYDVCSIEYKNFWIEIVNTLMAAKWDLMMVAL